MSGSTEARERPEEPRESTIDLPRVDPAGPESGDQRATTRPSATRLIAAQDSPAGPAPARSTTATGTEPGSAEAASATSRLAGSSPANGATRARIPDDPDGRFGPGRPPAGSLADLRSRLARLPYGHPSSPYDDGGVAKLPPPRLRQLELGLPAPERQQANDTALHREPEPAAMIDMLAEFRNGHDPELVRNDVPAASEPGVPAASEPDAPILDLEPSAGLDALLPDPAATAPDLDAPVPDLEPSADPDALPPDPAAPPGDLEPLPPDPSTPTPELHWPVPDLGAPVPDEDAPSEAPDRHSGNGSARRPDGYSTAAYGAPLITPDARPGQNGNGRRHARDDLQDPYALAPSAGRTGNGGPPRQAPGNEAPAPLLSAEHEEVVRRALTACRTAEGRNMFGSYGNSGITPAVRRVAQQLPHGGLAPDSEPDSLKSADRFAAKLARLIARFPGTPAENLAASICDAIRYAFVFEPAEYTEGTLLVHRKLKAQGFELEARRNRWDSPEYKGIWTCWRDPAHDQPFEVQFHTTASWDVVRRTHDSYMRITDPATSPAERARLRARQVAEAASASPPPRCSQVADFRLEPR